MDGADAGPSEKGRLDRPQRAATNDHGSRRTKIFLPLGSEWSEANLTAESVLSKHFWSKMYLWPVPLWNSLYPLWISRAIAHRNHGTTLASRFCKFTGLLHR